MYYIVNCCTSCFSEDPSSLFLFLCTDAWPNERQVMNSHERAMFFTHIYLGVNKQLWSRIPSSLHVLYF